MAVTTMILTPLKAAAPDKILFAKAAAVILWKSAKERIMKAMAVLFHFKEGVMMSALKKALLEIQPEDMGPAVIAMQLSA